jgi:hypothetical protein
LKQRCIAQVLGYPCAYGFRLREKCLVTINVFAAKNIRLAQNGCSQRGFMSNGNES